MPVRLRSQQEGPVEGEWCNQSLGYLPHVTLGYDLGEKIVGFADWILVKCKEVENRFVPGRKPAFLNVR